MPTDAVSVGHLSEARKSPPLLAAIAWRNLWRNTRRTWLTSGGVAFAVFLVVIARSFQDGSFDVMIDNATGMLTGHAQIQNVAFADDPSLRNTVTDASRIARRIAGDPNVAAVAQRGLAFALVSVGERSFGAQVMGVEPDAERVISTLPALVREGTYLEKADDVVIGAALARNLGAHVGDEIVVLGTAKDGSIAAFAGDIAGIIDTGIAEVERGLLQIPLPQFQAAFGLGDEAHAIVVRVHGLDAVDAVNTDGLGDELDYLPWQRLMPEIDQTVELKRVGTRVIFGLVTLLVTFSVFNTFIMLVYERVREFGMLLAVGMRPRAIVAMLELEAVWLAVVGVGLGLLVSTALVLAVAQVGIPLPDVGEVLRQYHLPDRIFPSLSTSAMVEGAVLMCIAVPLAGLLPALRIVRLAPVTALRSDA